MAAYPGLAIAVLALAQAADSEATAIADYLAGHARPALEALAQAAADHPIVLLGDVHPSRAPKRFLVDLLSLLQRRGLIDALALEVPVTQSPAIREYLASEPEDVGLLTAHPLLLRAHWGLEDEMLAIYRTVWALNRDAPDEARIEILAIDAPRGPPMVTSRRAALSRYVNRDAVMELQVARWREQRPNARLLVFIGDLHTLKAVEANVEFQGEFDRLLPLAERLVRRWPAAVYSVFSDAAPPGHRDGASRLFTPARDVLGPRNGLAVEPNGPLATIAAPVNLESEPGTPRVEILPRSYTLGRVCDLYLFFGAEDR